MVRLALKEDEPDWRRAPLLICPVRDPGARGVDLDVICPDHHEERRFSLVGLVEGEHPYALT